MGQYYRIVNADKRMQMLPFDYDNGLKLMEWSYDKNRMVLALMNLLGNEWKGDRVYVVGDYADLNDMNEVWAPTLKELVEEFSCTNYHDYAGDFPRVMPDKDLRRRLLDERYYPDHAEINGCTEDLGYRYIYNHATRQVIDLDKCPVEWVWYDVENDRAYVDKIAPLSLLLAMGNGRGGGDYRGDGAFLVGSWCSTTTSIEVAQEPLPGCEDYEDFHPDFTENTKLIPWNAEDSAIAKAKTEALERYAG